MYLRGIGEHLVYRVSKKSVYISCRYDTRKTFASVKRNVSSIVICVYGDFRAILLEESRQHRRQWSSNLAVQSEVFQH